MFLFVLVLMIVRFPLLLLLVMPIVQVYTMIFCLSMYSLV